MKKNVNKIIDYLNTESIINTIKSDINKTDDEQKALRKNLSEKLKEITIFEKELSQLDDDISAFIQEIN